MAFGWSAGDILTAINFILDVASALDDVSGSGHDYRNTTSFLGDLSEHALAPLLTCPALDAYPEYKASINKQVVAIKEPVSRFVEKVKGLEKDLGVPHKGRARFFKGWKGKLKWHFFTAKQAEALKEEIEPHIRIIDQLMARLPVSMIHDFKQDMPEIVHKAVTDVLDAHEGINEVALEKVLEEIFARNFERYFGSQQVKLTKSGTLPPEYTPATSQTTVEMLRSSVSHLKSRCQFEILDQLSGTIDSIAVHPEIAFALERWWNDEQSVSLWIQGPPEDTPESSLPGEMVAMARGANISVAAFFCQRLSLAGTAATEGEQIAGLLYSLIYQLVHNIPPNFSGTIDFDRETITKLDGTLASLAPAMLLLQYLLSVGSGPVLLVVDSFDLLDSGGDAELQGQIKTLLEIIKSPLQSQRKVKAFFYSSEPSITLLTDLEPGGIVDATQLSGLEGVFAFND